jgi:serine protease AprX
MPFYTTASGTSFSAPVVAGTIALMHEVNSNLRPAEVKDILQRSATPLPNYYNHEVGAGMLNAYAAVLESAFPWRRTGLFRSILSSNAVEFSTSTIKNLSGAVSPTVPFESTVAIPANTVQASVNINWGGLTSANDLGLKVFGEDGALRGESNYLNLPGLTGKREKVTVNRPRNENWRVAVRNSLGVGTAQDFVGTVSATQIRYLDFKDLQDLATNDQTAVYDSIGSYLVLSDGKKFRPFWSVSRSEFAEALVRSGRVPQYVAAKQMFTDVRDLTTRAAVESVQSNPSGRLFIDASNGVFRPSDATTRLVAAVALRQSRRIGKQCFDRCFIEQRQRCAIDSGVAARLRRRRFAIRLFEFGRKQQIQSEQRFIATQFVESTSGAEEPSKLKSFS